MLDISTLPWAVFMRWALESGYGADPKNWPFVATIQKAQDLGFRAVNAGGARITFRRL